MTTTELRLTPDRVLEALKAGGVTHVVWLPDSESSFMYQALAEEPSLALVPVCRETEALAIAVGLMMGGRRPVCLIQNTGFMESGDSLRGLVLDVKIPLLMLIGYRGWRGGAPMTDSAATYLEPLLKAWEVHYWLLESDADLPVIAEAFRHAETHQTAVAVLVGREWER